MNPIRSWLAEVLEDGRVRVSCEGDPIGIWPSLLTCIDDLDPETKPMMDLTVALRGVTTLPSKQIEDDDEHDMVSINEEDSLRGAVCPPKPPAFNWLAVDWSKFEQDGDKPPMLLRQILRKAI